MRFGRSGSGGALNPAVRAACKPAFVAPVDRLVARPGPPAEPRLLVLADAGRTCLEIGVNGLAFSHRLVGFPPALLAGLPGDRDDLRPAITVDAQGIQDTERESGEIDTSVAHAARVYDYLLGGKANFSVDGAPAQRRASRRRRVGPPPEALVTLGGRKTTPGEPSC